MRAAEATLHAASANVGVAIANQLPQFSITGQLRHRGAGLHQPVHARQRRSGASPAASPRRCSTAARCCTRSAPPSRRSTRRRRSTAARSSRRSRTSPTRCARCRRMPTRCAPQAAAERTAAASLDLAREQYQLGAITYLTLLNAERTYQQARISLVQAEASASPTPPRCSRRWAAAGGIATTSPPDAPARPTASASRSQPRSTDGDDRHDQAHDHHADRGRASCWAACSASRSSRRT